MKERILLLIPLVIVLTFAWAQDLPSVPKVPPPLEQPPQRAGLQIHSRGENVIFLKSNTVYYTDQVVVVYPPDKPGDVTNILRCHELTATRKGKYIDMVIAVGDVEFDNGSTNHARGQRAVYTATNEQIVLTGPYGSSPLPMVYNDQGTNVGQMVIYDRIRDIIRFSNDVFTAIKGEALSSASGSSTNKNRTPQQDAPVRNSPPPENAPPQNFSPRAPESAPPPTKPATIVNEPTNAAVAAPPRPRPSKGRY